MSEKKICNGSEHVEFSDATEIEKRIHFFFDFNATKECFSLFSVPPFVMTIN